MFKADLKARKEAHLFRENYLCKRMCDRCGAIQSRGVDPEAMSYKDTRPDADYAGSIITHADYCCSAPRVSPWAAIGGWQIENSVYDFMHVCYLGTAASHIASTLKMLRVLGYHYEDGESEDLFLKRISLEMKETCRQNGCHVYSFNPNIFVFPGCVQIRCNRHDFPPCLASWIEIQIGRFQAFCVISKALLATQGPYCHTVGWLWA